VKKKRKFDPAHGSGRYLPLPLVMLRSKSFAGLSSKALKLLLDVTAQFNGYGNNGALSVSWTLMRERGWKSRDTLHTALRELLAGDWLVLTRQGGRHRCSLYGLTFYKLDGCPKSDLDPPYGKDEAAPRGGWFRDAPAATPEPARGNGLIRRCTTGGSIDGLNVVRLTRRACQLVRPVDQGDPTGGPIEPSATRRAG
jgi:hypothetical protein